MSSFFSRRSVLATGAGAALGLGAIGATANSASAAPATASRHSAGREETRTLDELYQAALKEGGKLVVYAGGDTPTQQDGAKAAFKARFPDIDLTLIVDYSKYHDVRVDNQLATGSSARPPSVSAWSRSCAALGTCWPGNSAGPASWRNARASPGTCTTRSPRTCPAM